MIVNLTGLRYRFAVFCIIFYAITLGQVQAELNPGDFAYTQASLSNLRISNASNAKLVHKLPINTAVSVIEKKGDWLFVDVSGGKSFRGWLHKKLLADRPLTLDVALKQYKEKSASDPLRLQWIERAAALQPNNIVVLDKLVKTLLSLKEYERAGQVLTSLSEVKANRIAAAGISKDEAARKGSTLLEFLKQLSPSRLIRGNFILTELEHHIDMPIYRSGPHQNGHFNFSSTDEFGIYNPEFIQLVIDQLLRDDLDEPIFAELQKQLLRFRAYDERILSLSQALCVVYKQPNTYKKFKEEYLELINSGKHFSAYSGGFQNYRGWGNISNYNAEDLAFLARREWGGSFELIKLGLERALKRWHYEKYHQNAECFQETNAVEMIENVYFVSSSFVDHQRWGDRSALSCRRELINQHQWRDRAAITTTETHSGRIGLDYMTQREDEIMVLTSKAKCPSSLISGPHYAFIKTVDGYRWLPVELDFSLKYNQSFGGCTSQRLLELVFKTNIAGQQPILFRMTKPKNRAGYLADTTEELSNDKNIIMVKFDQVPSISKLYKVYEKSTWTSSDGPSKPQEVVSKIELWVEFNNGKKTMLIRREGIGKYSYSPPEIRNIIIMDANGDNEPDFMFDIDNGGKLLVFTENTEIIKTITLLTDEYSGVGGC